MEKGVIYSNKEFGTDWTSTFYNKDDVHVVKFSLVFTCRFRKFINEL